MTDLWGGDKPNFTDITRFAYTYLQRKITGVVGTIVLHLKANLFGIEIGSGVVCYGRIDIMPAIGSTIKIGNNVSIVSSSARCTAGPIFAPTKLRTWSKTSKIIIEDGVGLNGTAITCRSRNISIGADTMIAPNVIIFDSDFNWGMTTTYKQKLIGEINALPEELIHRFYRIMHTLRSELINQTAMTPKRGSLKGIWGDLKIDDTDIFLAKKSLFSYEYKDAGR